jgi:hypothetical protein
VKNCRPDAPPPLAPRLWCLFWVTFISIIACTPWPMGKRIQSDSVGLVGEWRDPAQENSPKHAVLRFRSNGRSELVLKTDRPQASEDAVWTSRWELHQGHGSDSSTRVVCFNVHRGRGWPLCKSVRIDAGIDSAGKFQWRLTLEGWIGYSRLTKETWVR